MPTPHREELSPWQREWVTRLHPGLSWEEFIFELADLMASTSEQTSNQSQHPPRPRFCPPAGQIEDLPERVREATRIQRLYRQAPKRAMREILGAARRTS